MINKTSGSVALDHPRLLVGHSELRALREKVKAEPFAGMFNRLREDAEKDSWAVGPASEAFDDNFIAHRCAFLYLLTGNDEYARKSRAYVEKIIHSEEWANANTKGLMLYNKGVNVAFAYDHCHGAPSWDPEFLSKVSGKIREMADVIVRDGGTEQNRNDASNWQGLRYSAGGICLLATDDGHLDENALNVCYERVLLYLRANLGDDPGSRGWNIEGLGYTYYPMGNGVAPFAIAMQRRNPLKDVRKEVPASRWTLWTCYATLAKTEAGLVHPDFGDDNPSAAGEGCYAFAFWFCIPEIQAGLKWWYDRTVGARGDGTFDAARFGTVASILYYPPDQSEEDPLTLPAWRDALTETGGNGYVAFRNQYRNKDDIVAQLYAKLRGARGHSGPDALSFRIVGLDTIWATGGGRYGLKTNGLDVYKRSQNTLYPVNPDEFFETNNKAGRFINHSAIGIDGGGHVTLHIAENNLGTKNHARRFLADYVESGAAAAFVISDTSDNGLFWQLNTLETNSIETEGNTFTVRTPTGPSLKGTVLYPPNVSFQTGSRPRGSAAGTVNDNRFITFSSGDGCYLVVLTLARKGQSHPAATAIGTWAGDPDGTVTLGNLRVKIKGNDITRY